MRARGLGDSSSSIKDLAKRLEQYFVKEDVRNNTKIICSPDTLEDAELLLYGLGIMNRDENKGITTVHALQKNDRQDHDFSEYNQQIVPLISSLAAVLLVSRHRFVPAVFARKAVEVSGYRTLDYAQALVFERGVDKEIVI